MEFSEEVLNATLQGSLLRPERCNGTGVVVLGGSSGRIDLVRAGLFAERGVLAIALRWFGGEGQSPGICEIPIEIFSQAIDRLREEGCDRIGIVGTSKGAEAALLVASYDLRVDIVVAVSPSSVVWANVGPGKDGFEWPLRSCFSRQGSPFPFVPHEAEALLSVNRLPPIHYLSLFKESLRSFAGHLLPAAIPIERSRAEIVLVAGGDDALRPSAAFAEALAARLERHGKVASLLINATAGHRVLLPGESTPKSTINAHGGTDEADRELGRAAWSEIARLFRFES